MVQLTREQAAQHLLTAGCPQGKITTNFGVTIPTHWVMVGIGCAESMLIVEAQSPPNSDGSVDNGIWQINDRFWPQFNPERLREDPVYAAKAAVTVLLEQGLRAWYAYRLKDGSPGPYLRHMPPGQGGSDLYKGVTSRLRVKSWQAFLNRSSPTPSPLLVVDGDFGALTEGATVRWKKARRHPEVGGKVDAETWRAAGLM